MSVFLRSGVIIKPIILAFITSPLLAVTALFCSYFLPGFLLPQGGYYSGDQGVKYAQIDALARSHTLSVGSTSEELSVFRPAFDAFYRQVGSTYQAIFSPAYALVVLPFYLLIGMRGLVIPAIFGTLLSAYGSGLIGKTLGSRYPGAIVFVVGLATPLIFYAFVLWEHALSVGLVVMATYLTLKKRAMAAGILAALAIWFRPETMLFGPALALAVLVAFDRRAGTDFIVRFAIGLFAGIMPWWAFNFINFGTFLGPQIAQNPITLESRMGVIANHLLPLGQREWALLLGLVLILLMFLYLLRRSRVPALLLLLFGAVGINCLHFSDYMDGTATSVTDIFPFAFASLISLIWLYKDVRIKLIWTLAAGYLFSITLLASTWGGFVWGPRMLLGVFPLLATLGWKGFEAVNGRLIKFACLTLLALSIMIQMAGLWHLSMVQKQWRNLNAELASLGPTAVATAVWWLPQVATPAKKETRWYGITNDKDVGKLVSFEKCFWWIWSDEPKSAWWESQLHHLSLPPNTNLSRLEVRKLSTRGLEAVRYSVVR